MVGQEIVLLIKNIFASLSLDEIHHYPNWAIEIKNIYDSFPKLKIVFTGSSLLQIYKSTADLSRRVVYEMLEGLSAVENIEFV